MPSGTTKVWFEPVYLNVVTHVPHVPGHCPHALHWSVWPQPATQVAPGLHPGEYVHASPLFDAPDDASLVSCPRLPSEPESPSGGVSGPPLDPPPPWSSLPASDATTGATPT